MTSSRAGVGTSRVFEVRGPMMVKDEYENASMSIKLYHKDISVIDDFAAGLGVPTPLFSASLPVYAKALAMGSATSTPPRSVRCSARWPA